MCTHYWLHALQFNNIMIVIDATKFQHPGHQDASRTR